MPPVATELRKLDAASTLYATQFVDLLLTAALETGASDLHLRPTAGGLLVEWRIDGVLQPLGDFPRGKAADVVTRLKVMAELLTYRTDVPQEGRVRRDVGDDRPLNVEIRISTFPTLYGERAAVRLFATQDRYQYVAELALPPEIEAALLRLLNETSGAILLTGPAGSGKTTTAYSCLRDVARASQGRRSIVTLEDPVESALDGVSQSQVQPAAGFTLATGLRSLMRQDPEVILVGEIRDTETAATVFQASLTGHLVISTFHAGSGAGALSRLLDMGIEPYLITSGLRAVVHQRLVRRLCECVLGATAGPPGAAAGSSSSGCDQCRHTGYRGRLALAEMLPPLTGDLNRAILDRRDTAELGRVAIAAGMTSIFDRAAAAIAARQTDQREIHRVLGFPDAIAPPAG
jgi:general secretion pathway protein E